MIYPDKGTRFKSIKTGMVVEFERPLNDGKKSVIVKDSNNKRYKISLDDLFKNFEDYKVISLNNSIDI